MKIQIRQAVPGDCGTILRMLEEIAELHRKGRPDIFRTGSKKYSEPEFAAIINNPSTPVFVAVDNDRVVGYGFCKLIEYQDHPMIYNFRTLFIDDFFVERTLRGQSVGTMLFHWIQDYAKKKGCKNIELNVWEFNEQAIHFYEKCGMFTQKRRMELTL